MTHTYEILIFFKMWPFKPGQTDGQTDRQTDGQTDGGTDGRTEELKIEGHIIVISLCAASFTLDLEWSIK